MSDILPKNWDQKTQEQKEQWLRANADSIDESFVEWPLSEDELQRQRYELTNVSVQIHNTEEEKKRIMEEYKQKIKPLKDRFKSLIESIKNKAQQVESEVFEIKDHENGYVYLILPDGTEYSRRRMLPDERQTTIHSINRKEAN